jgi:hypothetical protein
MEVSTTNTRWFQIFRYNDQRLHNERGKVMAVSGDNVIIINHEKSTRTKWTVVYVDENWKPKEPEPPKPKDYKIGEYVPEYGLKYGVPFYIVSQLGENRYMDMRW